MEKQEIYTLIEERKYSESLKHIEKILAENQFDLEALAMRAKVYYRQQEFVNAIDEYNQLMNLDPTNLDHIADRGLCYHMLGEHDQALEDFDTVIKRESDNPYWYSCRAFIKDYIKDHEGSLADYERALELDPDDAIALNNKGLVEEKMGYAARAQQSFARADRVEGIDLEKEIGHLNIPIESDEQEDNDLNTTTPTPQTKNALRNYLQTLRSLVTSSQERQNFLDFLLGRRKAR